MKVYIEKEIDRKGKAKRKMKMTFFLCLSTFLTPLSGQDWSPWLNAYLTPTELDQLSDDPPLWVARAIKRMFRAATLRDIDVGPAFDLTSLVLDEPERPLWATCGTTVRFFGDVLDDFGYNVELLSLFRFSSTSSHVGHIVARVSGPRYSFDTFVDPLYGVYLSDDGSRKATVGEAVADVLTGGIGLFPVDVEPFQVSNHPQYAKVNDTPYTEIFRPGPFDPASGGALYFNAVVMRDRAFSFATVLVIDETRIDRDAIGFWFPDTQLAFFNRFQ